MISSLTNLFRQDPGIQLTCHKCRTKHKVRHARSLRDGARSTCTRCGTRFGVCVIITNALGDQPPAEPDNGGIDVAAVGPPSETPAGSRTLVCFFQGTGGTLFGIHMVNLCLTLLTLGVYRFWAKAKVRAYLWSQTELWTETEFADDRFAYHGTGKELLVGFLRAVVIFGIPYALLANGPSVAGAAPWIQTVASLLAGVLVMLFIPVAIVAARRYRLSRTSWRGIRFSFRGPILQFVTLWIKGAILTGLTLGIYYPFFASERQAFLVSHSQFGNRGFRFNGNGWDLLKAFFIPYTMTSLATAALIMLSFYQGLLESIHGMSGAIVSLVVLYALLYPILWGWYLVKQQRYFWNQTSLGGSRFQSSMTPWTYFKLKSGNFFLLVVTLGFAWPWTTVRNIRYVLSHLTLQAPTDLEAILQDKQTATPTGEGLDSFLDTGFEFG